MAINFEQEYSFVNENEDFTDEKGEENKDMQGDCCLAAHANATPPWSCMCSCHDNIDRCLVCGTEIPPGPDFCSASCEERAGARSEDEIVVD